MQIKRKLTEALQEVSALKGDLKEVTEIRRELLKIEAADASAFLKKKLAALVVIMISGFFFACVAIATLIGVLGALLKSVLPESVQPFSWQIVAMIVALVFMIVSLVFLQKLKKKPTEGFFKLSLQELKNDSVWIKSLTSKEKNN